MTLKMVVCLLKTSTVICDLLYRCLKIETANIMT